MNVTIATTKSKATFEDNEDEVPRPELSVSKAGTDNPGIRPSAPPEPPAQGYLEPLDLTSNTLRQAPSLNVNTFFLEQ